LKLAVEKDSLRKALYPIHRTMKLPDQLLHSTFIPTFPRDIQGLVILKPDVLVGEDNDIIAKCRQDISEFLRAATTVTHILVSMPGRE
jgi:hypothetical protein